MTEDKKPKQFEGLVISDFAVGTKKSKKYKKGEKFSTKNQDVFRDLVKKQKIK